MAAMLLPNAVAAVRGPGRTGPAAVLILALLIGGCGKKQDKPTPPPPEAGYVVLKAESVPLTSELAGRTAAYETSEVRPQVNGLIKARLFKEGALVQKGQTLYQIDQRLYVASVDQAVANLQSAQANQQAAQIKAGRYKPLAQIQAVAQQDYTDAAATAKQAVATTAQNRAALETARINLGYTRVPAPITGRIGRSLYTVGALVTAAQTNPLTTIQRLDPIFVDIPQNAADLLALRRGLTGGGVVPDTAQVRLKLEDGSDYGLTGMVQFSEVTVDQSTGTVTIRAVFPNPKGVLLPGMYVRALLTPVRATDAILVPQQGIQRDPTGKATVLLVGPGDKAVQRDVVTTRTVGDKWLVSSGLKPGDKVIVEGTGNVKPGQPIRPVPAGSKPKPAPPPAGGAQGPAKAS